MKFSFILPAWKRKYLRDAINSIMAQTYTDYELVVIDDCSPDISYQLLTDEFQFPFVDCNKSDNLLCKGENPKLKYYRNDENIGGNSLVAQWNHCIQYAKGKYIIIATDDDLYEPNFLEEISLLIDNYPQVDLFRSRILQIEDGGKILGMDGYFKECMTFAEFAYYMRQGMKSGIPQYVFKKKALTEAGGFVEFPHAWASDDASALLMAKNGVAICNKTLVKFRLSSGINITSNQSLMPEKTKAMLQYYKWMLQHFSCIKVVDSYTEYLYRNTVSNLRVYAKQIIMNQINPTPWRIKMSCYVILLRGREFSLRDKLSIICRTL